jgi:hypothetical protein
MPMFIEVSQILHAEVRRRENASRGGGRDPYRDTDEPGEGQVVQSDVPAEPITPTMINLLNVRSITPRKDRAPGEPRTGCRIVFVDGRGFAVTDGFAALSDAATVAGFLTLTKVVSMRRGRPTDDDDEDGHVTSPSEPGEEPTQPCLLNPHSIRSFNRRKDDDRGNPRLGCRLMFSDGRGFPVLETFDILLGMVNGSQAG